MGMLRAEWRRELDAKMSDRERKELADYYRRRKERATLMADLDAIMARNKIVGERIAAAVAEGQESGAVPCPCGGVVRYEAPNEYGVRKAQCSTKPCYGNG